MDELDKVFENLDLIVVRSLGKSSAEVALTEAYVDFWKRIKQKVGTSSNFTGLSEYLFFRYTMKYLEGKLDTEFRPHEETPDTFSFRSDRIMLTHDIDISRFIKVPKQKTDIAIFEITGHGFRLLAAFELKIFISSPVELENDLRRLESLGLTTDALLFEIILVEPTRGEKGRLLEFCQREEYRGRAFVISQYDLQCNIELDDAIDRALQVVER